MGRGVRRQPPMEDLVAGVGRVGDVLQHQVLCLPQALCLGRLVSPQVPMHLPTQAVQEAALVQETFGPTSNYMEQAGAGLELWVATRLLVQHPARPAIYQRVGAVVLEGTG